MVQDIINKRFNKLVAIRPVKDTGYGWLFKCDCGNEKVIFKYNVISGHTKSCGCERSAKLIQRNTRHGMRKTIFYKKYYSMKRRCENPASTNYKYYGGRGIKVLWKSFEDFRDDMYESYLQHVKLHKNDTTLDRIDSNKHYSKQNCRWVPQREQKRNTRKNKFITYKGKTMIIADWSREYNIDHRKISLGLKNGLTPEQIFKPR